MIESTTVVWKIFVMACALGSQPCEEVRSKQSFGSQEQCMIAAKKSAHELMKAVVTENPTFRGRISIGCVEVPLHGEINS